MLNTNPNTSQKKNPALAYLSRLGSSRSVITISNCLKHIAVILGASDIETADWARLKRNHWTEIKKTLTEKGCSGATQNLYLTAFKTVAKEAWTLDLIPQSSYLKIQALTGVKYERLPKGRSLTGKEACGLLAACDDGTNQGKRDKAMFALMLGCGLRRAEIVQLEMKNWDCCNRSFCFIGKGNKERRVFVPKKIDRIIDEWLMARGLEDGIFFPRICPGADKSKLLFRTMQPSSIYRILQKRAGLAELGKVRPHDLRRTFATRMLEQGCDLFILQRAMGHTSVATTSRYDYRGETSREEVCKHLDVFL
ncbi:tyrosine-type recombinase/integrase [Parasutterella excrementihominis]|uniref:tyrosine-type recombinase/integrase n=1 Tax=Parasutterella excrementihominis TaxID=487175 RepID=UPI00242F2EE1|nr:site-specific integrase [Parasutterella excrementihominis]